MNITSFRAQVAQWFATPNSFDEALFESHLVRADARDLGTVTAIIQQLANEQLKELTAQRQSALKGATWQQQLQRVCVKKFPKNAQNTAAEIARSMTEKPDELNEITIEALTELDRNRISFKSFHHSTALRSLKEKLLYRVEILAAMMKSAQTPLDLDNSPRSPSPALKARSDHGATATGDELSHLDPWQMLKFGDRGDEDRDKRRVYIKTPREGAKTQWLWLSGQTSQQPKAKRPLQLNPAASDCSHDVIVDSKSEKELKNWNIITNNPVCQSETRAVESKEGPITSAEELTLMTKPEKHDQGTERECATSSLRNWLNFSIFD